MEAVDAGECGVAVVVHEPPRKGCSLPQETHLQPVPDGVSGEQHPAVAVEVEQSPDAAWGMAGQVHEHDRAVGEQIMAAVEGEHRRPVEVIGVEPSPPKRQAGDSYGRTTGAESEVALNRQRPHGHLFGKFEEPCDVVPVQMGGQHKVDVVDISANPLERISKPSHRTVRGDQRS